MIDIIVIEMMRMMVMIDIMMMMIIWWISKHTGRDSLFPDHHLWPTIYQMVTCQSTQHGSYDNDKNSYDDDDESYDDDDDGDDDGDSNSDEFSSHCRHTGVNINSSTPNTLKLH